MAKKGHGHHGGAWKVAYADFVTAMMALFLVLWLVSQDQKIKEAVERSFRNPFNSLTKQSTGVYSTKPPAKPFERQDPKVIQDQIDALPHPTVIEQPQGAAIHIP